jgi:hypothetical protein
MLRGWESSEGYNSGSLSMRRCVYNVATNMYPGEELSPMVVQFQNRTHFIASLQLTTQYREVLKQIERE